jgi:hypothetical protein
LNPQVYDSPLLRADVTRLGVHLVALAIPPLLRTEVPLRGRWFPSQDAVHAHKYLR